MSHPEPDRQCIACGKFKHPRKFISGTYICQSCSKKNEKKARKKNG